MITNSSSPTAPRSPAGSSAPAASSASRPSRSTPTPTPTCPTSREADHAVRLPGNAPGRHLPARRPRPRRRPPQRRRRDPPRLRLPERERRLRPRGDRRRAHLGRAGARVDRADGLQDRGQEADGGGRRAGAHQPHRRDRDRGRPAAAGQGLRRRRWSRHADRAHPRRPARRDRRRPRPRRRRRSATAPSSSSPTSSAAATSRCRSSATRRRPRARRARLLDPAPAPEGRRGGPGAAAPRATTRAALHEAARAAAAAIDYLGAGTVEFLYDADARPLLLPGDEHPPPGRAPGHRGCLRRRPGRLQLAAGRGSRAGSILARGPSPGGHAIEVRLYAEDPAADYQPQSGLLTTFEVPTPTASGRLGFVSGSEVSTHYDAMLAKVIAWAPTREQAARKLADALARPGSTAWSPTATCWSASCATRRSCPAR